MQTSSNLYLHMLETLLILDFGSQYTQLIARRIRELNVYCEIHPFNKIPPITEHIKGIILSGSPYSVRNEDRLEFDLNTYRGNIPILGICYGAQYIADTLGGNVERSSIREYGRSHIQMQSESRLLKNIPDMSQVWMSHGDTITSIPEGFSLTAGTEDIPVAAFENETDKLYAIQFHPEVTHSVDGSTLLSNFVIEICNCNSSWTPASFVETSIADLRTKLGSDRVVLGLSGGVDSALVAAIATAALGKENVIGVLMPSPYSSEHSISDALALAANLDIQTQILPIGELMQSFDNSLGELFAGTEFGIAEENLQSRIRGNLLMAISNKFGYLLLSTGNKSEMAVGYCTLYGDMNGGLSVIADVPKTRVYSICKWLNSHQQKEVIPENILTKAPSAELKPGQVDQDSLPPYEILDDILDRLIHQHQSAGEIISAGHEPAIVDRVLQLLSRAEFKRRQAAPGLKITDRAFGTGWRMPIASSWSALRNI